MYPGYEEVETDTDTDEDLLHYGVMGMKWGRRRPRGKDGLVQRNGAKPLSEYTNDELTAVLRRYDMEKKYKTMLAEQKPKKGKAMKVAGSILAASGKAVATTYTTKYMGIGAAKLESAIAKQLVKKAVS